jgi:hypothetical protein
MSMKEKFWMFWLLALMVLGMLTSCKTKYIPIETVIRDSIEVNDTVRITNTQFVDRLVKDTSWMQIHTADSVELAKMGVSLAGVKSALVIERNTVKQLREKLSENNDTSNVKVVYIDRVKKVEVPVPVEKELTFWQKTWMNLGKIGFTGLLGLIGVIGVVFWVRKIIKKYRYE